MRHRRIGFLGAAALALWLLAVSAPAAQTNTLVWDKAKDRVTADVSGWELWPMLQKIAKITGWHILVEPGTKHIAAATFKDLRSGEALSRLLGDLNYSYVPNTNGPARFYVFSTSADHATQLIKPPADDDVVAAKRIPKQLVVTLKPGMNIDELARQLGAKVIGRIPELNAYRLEFDDEAATDNARKELAANPDAASVQDDYYVDVPSTPQPVSSASAAPVQLQFNPPADSGKVIVGVVDTAVQALGDDLEKFITKRMSVSGTSLTDDSGPMHGTAMMETALRTLQLLENGKTSVQFVTVDAFGTGESASTFSVAQALIIAANNGATVVNASLGGYADSPLLHQAVQLLTGKNIPVFAAAGNDGSANAFYPAAYPEVYAVTAVEQGRQPPYANYGSFVDLAAPGSSIFSYGGSSYLTQGTSVSSIIGTALAAGTADSSGKSVPAVIPSVLGKLPVPVAPKR